MSCFLDNLVPGLRVEKKVVSALAEACKNYRGNDWNRGVVNQTNSVYNGSPRTLPHLSYSLN